jgi:hypothetical protein
MWSIETDQTFPLSSVKPFEGLAPYRDRCLLETRQACKAGTRRRVVSPVNGTRLEPLGTVEGFEYLQCRDSGSVFLADLPPSEEWARLLSAVSRYRHSAETFHAGIAQTRSAHVYGPKLEWIQSTLRMQRLDHPRLLEVVTPPSDFTALLNACGVFSQVTTVNEMDLVLSPQASSTGRAAAAVLFESLDRVDDPTALIEAVRERLVPGGLIFITALVCSGFDVVVLGLRNVYLYPPDRTNCFSLRGLETFLRRAGFTLLEVSTPGVLDVEIVQTHLSHDPSLPLSDFERQLLAADPETREAFQTFLQQHRMSSFARIIGKKQS